MDTTEDPRPDYEIAKEQLQALIDSLKLTVECTEAVPKIEGDGVMLSYVVTINGQPFEYSMGIGHIPWDRVDTKAQWIKGTSGFIGWGLSETDWAFFRTYKSKPYCKFINTKGWAEACGHLAKVLKVKPSVVDVLACVGMDAQALHMTFDDWASDYGYDTDSREAERTWRACGDNARKALKFMDHKTLSAIQELGARL
jgi:hypothetical protein